MPKLHEHPGLSPDCCQPIGWSYCNKGEGMHEAYEDDDWCASDYNNWIEYRAEYRTYVQVPIFTQNMGFTDTIITELSSS